MATTIPRNTIPVNAHPTAQECLESHIRDDTKDFNTCLEFCVKHFKEMLRKKETIICLDIASGKYSRYAYTWFLNELMRQGYAVNVQSRTDGDGYPMGEELSFTNITQ